jgi:hypothetical protein
LLEIDLNILFVKKVYEFNLLMKGIKFMIIQILSQFDQKVLQAIKKYSFWELLYQFL